jgi:diguanylate cyclase (GGDEF)-like protein
MQGGKGERERSCGNPLAALREGQMESNKKSVLIVDDEKANIMTLTHILSTDYTVYAANNGKFAIELAKKHIPDIILLDIVMPEMDGYEVLTTLKSTYEKKNIPVIFVTGLGNDEDEEKGLSMGAEDYISKPFSPAIVKLRVSKLVQILSQIAIIKQLSKLDQQTGITTKNDFNDRIKLVCEHAKKNNKTVSVLLIEISNFEYYTQIYGEAQTDIALNVIARVIEQSLNCTVDIFLRLGATTFGVLLIGTDMQSAAPVAENIKANVEMTISSYSSGKVKNTVICVGVNSTNHDISVDEFIVKTEQIFTTAKIRGKIMVG